MNIVNVGYDSTNYYVLADSKPRLLVDAGWPGTLAKFQHQCKRMGVKSEEIRHFLVTHYHPDHAGLAQELKRMGSKLILMDLQQSAVGLMAGYMKPQDQFVEIDISDAITISVEESRGFLAKIGIQGEVVHTPGHSDDSVTLVLDEGAAFTGDFIPVPDMGDETSRIIQQGWAKLRAAGVKTVYPGHGPVWTLGQGRVK